MHYKSDNQEIPPEIENQHSIDITASYYKTIDMDVELTSSPPKGNNCAFLCVYNRDQWTPVDWGKINNDTQKVHFKNINDSLLYCVMYYDWMKLKPATQPFFSVDSTTIKSFSPNSKKRFSFSYTIKQKKVNQSYKLFVWDGRWQEIASNSPINDGLNTIVEFKNIPSGGLYKVDDRLRPFWFVNGKLVRSEPGVPFGIKQLNNAEKPSK